MFRIFDSKFLKIQMKLLIALILIIIFVYLLQIILGANFYSQNQYGYTDENDLHLINTYNFYLIYGFLLIIIISLPTIGIFLRKYRYIWFNVMFSLFYLFILGSTQQLDWFYSCYDICGFFTIFISPMIIIFVGIISSGILFLFNKIKKIKS